MMDGVSLGLEESKCHCCFQEVQKGGSEGLWASHLHLSPCEADGANNPGNHYQTRKVQSVAGSR